MSNNQLVLSIAFGIYTGLVLLGVAWTFLPRARSTLANRLEKSIGLAIPVGLRPTIGRQAARRARISLTGLILAAWAVLPFVWSINDEASPGISTPPMFLVVGAMFAGAAIGTAIGSLPRTRRLDKDSIRYARPEAVTLDDYVAPLVRRGAWAAVGLATLIYLSSVIVSTTGIAPIALLPPTTFGGIMVALAIASLAFFETMGHRMVGRAQPTGSEPELVWGDAMRSTNVSGLAMAPIALGFYGLVTCTVDFAIGFRHIVDTVAALITVNVFWNLGIVAIILIGIYAITSRPQRHFLRRLWPQYLNVGAPPVTTPESEKINVE